MHSGCPLTPSFRIQRKSLGIPRVEITALIDVVFLLLIFVLLASKFVVVGGFEVSLPEAAPKEVPGEHQHVLQIPRSSNSPFFFNGVSLSNDRLLEQLKEIREEDAQATLVIATDARAQSSRLIRALELIEQAGLRRIRIAVRQRPAPPPEE